MGVALTCAAVGNVLYSGCKVVCCGVMNGAKDFKYTGKEATMQIAMTLLAPIAVVPVVVMGGCALALSAASAR